MNKALLASLLLLICCLPIYPQDDIDMMFTDLNRMEGRVVTYYSGSSNDRARYLQDMVEDASAFFEGLSGDTTDFVLLLLEKNDWKNHTGNPYPLSSFEDDPNRIIMPLKGFLRIKLRESLTLYGKNTFYAYDFVAVHELGHHLSRLNRCSGIPWAGELFSDYVQIGFMHEKIPYFDLPEFIGVLFTCLPFRSKTLQQFDANYHQIGPFNYMMYQMRFMQLANAIYHKEEWAYMQHYYAMHRQFKDVGMSYDQAAQMLSEELVSLSPEAGKWFKKMSPSPWPYLLLLLLALLASGTVVLHIRHRKSVPAISRTLSLTIKIIMILTLILLLVYATLFLAALWF